MVERARAASRLEAERILAEAEAEAACEKAEALARAAEEINRTVRLDEDTKRHAADSAIRCLSAVR